MREAENVACTKEKRDPYKVLMWKIEEKRPLGRSRPRRGIVKWILKK
jgi:hypothetical protein